MRSRGHSYLVAVGTWPVAPGSVYYQMNVIVDDQIEDIGSSFGDFHHFLDVDARPAQDGRRPFGGRQLIAEIAQLARDQLYMALITIADTDEYAASHR